MDIDFTDLLDRLPVRIFEAPANGAKWVLEQVVTLIREKAAANEKCVLGLATGSTPKLVYAELVRMHNNEGLSFQNVIAFNLDGYSPIEKDALQRYNRFMKTQLFDKVDIDPAYYFIRDGEVSIHN